MATLIPKITFKATAVPPSHRPSLPRSGACCAPLPAWHPHDVIMLGGYTEAVDVAPQRNPCGAACVPPGSVGGSAAGPRRAPTMEAWTFSQADGGRWHPITYAEDSAVPQPRLTSQAALVGDEVWLVGGWDPSAPPGTPQFLNDVWALDLRTRRWRRVEVAGEEVPRISRFAMASLPGGLLLLHTHRCGEDVLLMETASGGTSATSGAAAASIKAGGSAGDLVKDGGAGGIGAPAAAAEGGASARVPTLRRVPVRGVFPGDQSPPSRGLHSLILAAAPPLGTAPEAAAAAPPPESVTLLGGGAVAGTALYAYGGAPQSGPMYGDLWALDLGSMTWRELAPQGAATHPRCSHVAAAAGAGPRTRAGPGATAVGRYLVVIGGSYYTQSGRLQPLDDVAIYDTQSNRWVEANVEGPRPSPRNAAIMAPLRFRATGGGVGEEAEQEIGDRFVLHGGWWPFVESYNDTYIVTVTAREAP